jgi:hypothetical protein
VPYPPGDVDRARSHNRLRRRRILGHEEKFPIPADLAEFTAGKVIHIGTQGAVDECLFRLCKTVPPGTVPAAPWYEAARKADGEENHAS